MMLNGLLRVICFAPMQILVERLCGTLHTVHFRLSCCSQPATTSLSHQSSDTHNERVRTSQHDVERLMHKKPHALPLVIIMEAECC